MDHLERGNIDNFFEFPFIRVKNKINMNVHEFQKEMNVPRQGIKSKNCILIPKPCKKLAAINIIAYK